jgi:hypothetical protein
MIITRSNERRFPSADNLRATPRGALILAGHSKDHFNHPWACRTVDAKGTTAPCPPPRSKDLEKPVAYRIRAQLSRLPCATI